MDVAVSEEGREGGTNKASEGLCVTLKSFAFIPRLKQSYKSLLSFQFTERMSS